MQGGLAPSSLPAAAGRTEISFTQRALYHRYLPQIPSHKSD